MRKLCAVSFLALLATTSPANAQSDGSTAMADLAVMNTNTAVVSAMQNNVMQHLVRQPGVGKSSRFVPLQSGLSTTAQTAQTSQSQAFLSFTPSVTRRRTNLTEFAARLRSASPAGARELDRIFAQRDVIGEFGKALAPYGLRTDNIADAYTVWWTNSWQAANGDFRDLSRTTTQIVKQQAARGMLATPAIRDMNEAAKQEFAETLFVQAILFSNYVDTYKNNPAMMRQLGAAVRKGAKASGLDLDAMTLTDQGFVPSGKTGAADPAPGAPEQALAANAVATPPVAANDTSPPYILLAAAGGAGLGGVFLLGKMMGRRG
jgi:hypothetical protein